MKTIQPIIISSIIYVFTSLTIIPVYSITTFFSLEHVTWIVLLGTIVFIYRNLYKYGIPHWNIALKTINKNLIIGQIIGLIYVYQLSDFALQDYSHQYTWAFYEHMQLFILLVAVLLSLVAYKWKHGIYIVYAAIVEFLLLGFMFSIAPLAGFNEATYFPVTIGIQVLYIILFTILFISIWKNKYITIQQLQKNIPTLAVIVQLTYVYFLHKWYFSITDLFIINYEYVYLGHTLWMFIFAFLSISLGIRYMWNIVKIIGMVLIAVCLIKLFFIDLISISIIVRALLFIIVGIIGLIYSRILIKNNTKQT